MSRLTATAIKEGSTSMAEDEEIGCKSFRQNEWVASSLVSICRRLRRQRVHVKFIGDRVGEELGISDAHAYPATPYDIGAHHLPIEWLAVVPEVRLPPVEFLQGCQWKQNRMQP